MDNLRDLSFHLCSSEGMVGEGCELVERMEFPGIQRLHIKAELHFPFDDRTPAFKRTLFSALSFPDAVHLHLEMYASIDEDHHQCEEGDAYFSCFNEETPRIFRNVGQFPQVEDFHLEINNHNEDRYTIFSIPLNMLPNVKHFTLESNTHLDNGELDDPDEIDLEDELAVPPRVVGRVLPVLETITLDMPDASDVAEWVEKYLKNLKDQGELDGFRELVVMEDVGLDGRRKVSYLGDEALDWCRPLQERTF